MAFVKYAHAAIVHPLITRDQWLKVRVAGNRTFGSRAAADRAAKVDLAASLTERAAALFDRPFSPKDYLMSHATIVASVDTYSPQGVKLGKVLEDGFRVNRKYSDFRITPECQKYINNNCFVPGTLVTMADGTVKPIEDVRVGDEVLTHKGRSRRVLRTYQNPSSGQVLEIKYRASNERLYVTPEHPFFVFRPQEGCVRCGQPIKHASKCISHLLDRFYCSRACFYALKRQKKELLAEKQGEFIPASDLRDHHDFVTLPVPQETHAVDLTPGQARLIGLFLAEGYYELASRQDNARVGAVWAFHANERETLARSVRELLKSEFDTDCVVREHSSDNGIHVTTRTNRELTAFFSKWVAGNHSTDKTLHPDLLLAPRDIQMEILRGWFEGDGSSFDTGEFRDVPGDVRVTGTTACRSLASQLQILLHRVGIAPRIAHVVSEGRRRLVVDGAVRVVSDPTKECHSWAISCGGGWVAELVESTIYEQSYASAVEVRGGFQKVPDLRFLGGHCLQIIEAIGSVEYTGKVHNLEVEEDNSYLAGGVAVHNCDAWSRGVIGKSYQTFIGGHNFVEHVQIEDLSKGRIIDAVSRDLGESVYVDILIATERKHRDLIAAVESGAMSTLSMGCTIDGSICTKCGHWASDETEMCFPPGTRVLKADGKYTPIEEIVEGDLVVTHTGAIQPVLHTMSRHHEGHVTVLTVDGVPNPVRSTTGHRYWVLRPETHCQCGCGKPLRRTIEHERGSVKAFQRRFLPGHYSKRGVIHLPFAPANREQGAKLEFVAAKDIRKGDYLTFPIPQQVTMSPDATEEKARLIGFFLAEGSFIKRDGALVGVSFDFGAHEYETLAAEAEALLNKVWGRDERRTAGFDWRQKVARDGIKLIRRRKTSRQVPSELTCPSCGATSEYAYNVRFKKGRDDCYQCKVCKRQWVEGADRAVKARRSLTAESACTVRLMWAEAAEWFHAFCGEYAYGKALAPEVMYWPQEVQKHVLFGWLGGDGTQSRLGVTGNTASFDLLSQMHVLAARCGWYSRKQVTFDRRAAILDEVVNGSGPVTVRDSNGWLPSFSLTLPEPAGFGGEVRFTDPESARVTLSGVTDGFKRVGNWLIYRVRDTRNECYAGPVHNIEVAEDESYVVEGLAVHNCSHVKYEKGNTFFDEEGRRHIVAELCGHVTIDPTGGVHFIEGSWVETPAFTGAVLRNVIEPTAEMTRRARRVLSSPPTQWSKKSRMKAASGTVLTVSGRAARLAELRAEMTKKARLAQMNDMMMPDEDAGAAEPAKEEAPPLLQGLEDELTQAVLEKVKKRLQESIQGPDTGPNPEQSTSTNENLQHQAAVRTAAAKLYGGMLNSIARTASSDVQLVDRVAVFHQSVGLNVPVSVYRTALKVGAIRGYNSKQEFLTSCRKTLGRNPTKVETGALIRLGRLLSQLG